MFNHFGMKYDFEKEMSVINPDSAVMKPMWPLHRAGNE
jgi:hypothetical protein